MTGAVSEKAIEMEDQAKTWTCECGKVNKMNSMQLNQGGPAKCSSKKCKIVTVL